MAGPLDFLTARPIAHRGLHDRKRGVIENTPGAFRAAVAKNFAIECDVQLTADGEAAVFHDFALERLTAGAGRVAETQMAALRAIPMKDTEDRIGSLADMFALVHGQSLIVCEIKSRFNGDMRLTDRVAALAKGYRGPLVIKSFDPRIVAHWRGLNTGLPVGFIGQSEAQYANPEYDLCSAADKRSMANLLHLNETQPDFLSWRVADLETAAPFLWRSGMGRPLMSWTVRTPADIAMAKARADQMVFEGFLP